MLVIEVNCIRTYSTETYRSLQKFTEAYRRLTVYRRCPVVLREYYAMFSQKNGFLYIHFK